MIGELTMKSTLTLSVILLAGCSFAIDVSALPDAAFPDTEVSTNFTIAVGTVSVHKFGNEATRDIQGTTYLNGVLCQ